MPRISARIRQRDRNPPDDLTGQPQPCERQDVWRQIGWREPLLARERAEELRHDDGRRVDRQHVAERRQQQRGNRNRGLAPDLRAVTAQDEAERLAQALGIAVSVDGRSHGGAHLWYRARGSTKEKGPSPASTGDGPSYGSGSATGRSDHLRTSPGA